MKNPSKNLSFKIQSRLQELHDEKLSIVRPLKMSIAVYKTTMLIGMAIVVFLLMMIGVFGSNDDLILLTAFFMIIGSCYGFIFLFRKIKS